MTDPRVVSFTRDLLLPTYTEYAASPRLVRDFSVHIYRDAVDDPIHAMLVEALADHIRDDAARATSASGARATSASGASPTSSSARASRDPDIEIGPVLVLEDLDRARRPAPLGGRYVSAPTFRTKGSEIVVAPFVMYQMQFDGELHGFHHRYAALSEMPVEKVTRAMIVNHMLSSVSFFRMHAMSPTRPW